jgi:hypothetical protein
VSAKKQGASARTDMGDYEPDDYAREPTQDELVRHGLKKHTETTEAARSAEKVLRHFRICSHGTCALRASRTWKNLAIEMTSRTYPRLQTALLC